MTIANLYNTTNLPADNDQRLARLLDLVVLEPYIRMGKEWWVAQSNAIVAHGPEQESGKEILNIVNRYVIAKPEDYAAIAEDLQATTKTFDGANVPPIVKTLTFNYLGLSLRNIGKPAEAIEALASARASGQELDGPIPQLWPGYVQFNTARVQHKQNLPEWRETMNEAIAIRSGWLDLSEEIPATVRYGVAAEYYHAKALLVTLDKELTPQQIAGMYEEYVAFRDNLPTSFLAGAPSNYLVASVAKTWDGILADDARAKDIIPVAGRSPDAADSPAAPQLKK